MTFHHLVHNTAPLAAKASRKEGPAPPSCGIPACVRDLDVGTFNVQTLAQFRFRSNSGVRVGKGRCDNAHLARVVHHNSVCRVGRVRG